MRGVIKSIRLGGGGLIRPTHGDNARERFFEPHGWVPGRERPPGEKEEVEYEPSGHKGAVNVRPAGASVERLAAERALRKRRTEQERSYSRRKASGELFLNPYNFVRPLPDPILLPEAPETVLLGRCPPPPHDRFVGFSGRLTCRVTTCSPTFVSDSHQVRTAGQHKSYRFHRVLDAAGVEVPCIPASTLRGVVRSAFEAVTNSCWEHVAADRRLSRRDAVRGQTQLTPARIERRQEGGWSLRLMKAANVPRYTKDAIPVPPGVHHGSECFAELSGHHVRKLHAPANGSVPDGATRGWYFETGQNAALKKFERFFHPADAEPLPLDEAAVLSYVLLIADYRERYARQAENDAEQRAGERSRSRPPQDSLFLLKDVKVPTKVEECDGELVWVRFGKDGRSVEALSPVAIPRLVYARSICDNFPDIDAVKSCSEVNGTGGELRLCPACRTFGWVAKDDERSRDARAFRSRVRFGDARFEREAVEETPHTLAILSAPKPTTVRFYLLPKSGSMAKASAELSIDYDSGNSELRGRKFYRRRGRAAMETPKDEQGNEIRSGQNRTIRDHLKEKRWAEFEVVFQNLAPLELGALLWALELEPEWAHRLGYAKPLGMGSVQISVRAGVLFAGDRLAGGAGEAVLSRGTMDGLRGRFRARMAEVYGAAFESLPNVVDLRTMLGEAAPEVRLEVMYPRLPRGQEQKSFAWFVKNRSTDGGHWLDLADGDEGLPRDPLQPSYPVG